MLSRDQAIELACTVQGWMNRDELYFLYDRASEIPVGSCWVEVGVWKGRSALATALGLSQGSRIHCIDNFKGNPESDKHWEAEIPGWLSLCAGTTLNVAASLRSDITVSMATEDSQEAAKYYGKLYRDIYGVFIDASHTYDALRKDIIAWREVLQPGGILCGHDLHPDFPEVERAVMKTLPGWQMAIRNCLLDQATGKVIRETNAGTIWFWRRPGGT